MFKLIGLCTHQRRQTSNSAPGGPYVSGSACTNAGRPRTPRLPVRAHRALHAPTQADLELRACRSVRIGLCMHQCRQSPISESDRGYSRPRRSRPADSGIGGAWPALPPRHGR